MSNTLVENTNVDQVIQGIEVLKTLNPAGTKCPKCERVKLEGEKCGCELVPIVRIDYPNDGFGIFTYLKGYKQPFPGFADQNIVDIDAIVKRTLISSIRFFIDKPLRYTFPILLGFRKKFIKRYIQWFSEVVDAAYKQYNHPQRKYLPDERFCKSGRELLRVGRMFIGDSPTNRQFLMALVMMWEYDNAYRFRGQDVLSELNKEALVKNPSKEILRIVRLLLARERTILTQEGRESSIKTNGYAVDVYDKWKMVERMLRIALFISPSIKRFIVKALLEINLAEIKPTEGDWYYMSERWDYEFGGIPYRERLAKKLKEDEEWLKTLPPEPPVNSADVAKPAIGLLHSPSFWDLKMEDAEKMLDNLKTNFLKELAARKAKV